MKAKIQKGSKGELWLFVDRDDTRKTQADDLSDMHRSEDEGNVAYPILGDEVEAIRDACNVFLNERLIESMLKS